MQKLIIMFEPLLHKVFRFLLFVSSYIPLFVILFLKNISNLKLSLGLLLTIIFPLFVIKSYLDLPLTREPNRPIYIVDVTEKGSEVLNYIVCYIIPFISFNSDIIVEGKIDFPNLLAIVVLFMVICNLYMSSNLYYINPVITIFYDIHSAKTDKGEMIVVITNKKVSISKNKRLIVRGLSHNVYFHVTDRKNRITASKIVILIFILMGLLLWLNDDSRELSKVFISKVTKILNTK